MTPEALKSFARDEIRRCEDVLRSKRMFAIPMEVVDVRCDLRGRSRAGVAIASKNRIRLSLAYFEALGPKYRQTVAHEYAHLVVRDSEEALGLRRGRSHGRRWQHVMRALGYEPERTLSDEERRMAQSVKPARRLTRYVYECVNGGHVHKVTATVHVRAQNGRRYLCCSEGCVTKPRDERGIAFTGRIEKS